jgi:hypothetical protein
MLTSAKTILAGKNERMAETIRLRVEADDDSIIVTLPGTTFRVIYRKPSQYPGLVAFDLRGDSVTHARFSLAHGA